jgi:hypothetical protein
MMANLGIDAVEKDGFSIYPNPGTGSFAVFVPNAVVKQLTLRDLSGKEIQLNETRTDMGFEIQNLNLEAGVYYLSLAYQDGSMFTKPVQVIR